MLHDLLFVIWYFFPAGAANSAPVVATKLARHRWWNTPIDGGRTLRGKPILGPHKTWRGIAAGVIAATFWLWIEQLCVRHFAWAQHLTAGYDYAHYPTLILGPLFGLGALGGDALKSFFKRRRNTRSGGTWFPFDQLDYIIGGAVLSAIYIRLSFVQYALLFVLFFGLHLLVSYLGYLLKIKDEPF